MIKLIIFDFDGTLGDTRRNIVTTMQMTIAELGLASRSDDECASKIGLPLGRLKRVDAATIDAMTLEPQLEMAYKDRRIALPKEGGEILEPIKILRADIDYNKHMNNANYVRMAMELLPEDYVISGLRVEYRVAAKFGDSLVPTIYKNGETMIISLSIEENVAAIIEFC